MPSSQALHRPPPLSLLLTEPLRAALDFCAAKVAAPPAVRGDGHPVIVYPGLGAGALATTHLRSFLAASGFAAHDWGLGVNTGPEGTLADWLDALVARVRELQAGHGRRVSLIGWSLGGIYAREIAKACPDAVRLVVTLGTPFAALHGGNHAGPIFRWFGGDTSQLTPALQARLRERPPVPLTSVYSKSDGVVCWRGCLERRGPQVENVETGASHLGMTTHPETLRIVADRLAQPEGEWRPYRRPSARAFRLTTAPTRSRK